MNAEAYYVELKSSLLGRDLPVPVAEGEMFPSLPARTMALYSRLKKALHSEEGRAIFEFARREAARECALYPASTATNEQLRWARAVEQFTDKLAIAAVDFIAEIDHAQDQRSNPQPE